jgi:hypothetical protein
VQSRAGVASQHQLAVDEERVGRAVHEVLARGGALEHDPRRGERPVQKLARLRLVEDLDARKSHRLALPVVLHDDRAPVLNADHAEHGRIRGEAHAERDENEDDSLSHVVFFGAGECNARRRAQVGWESYHESAKSGQSQVASGQRPVVRTKWPLAWP